MDGEHKGEDPKIRLEQIEHSMVNLTSMVSQQLPTQYGQIPSTMGGHEHPNNEKRKPETKIPKNGHEKGECNYRKTSIPFCVESKVDIKPYVEEVDTIKLNQ